MLVMLFIYLAYLAFAQSTQNRGGSDRSLAVFGVIGAVNLPIIHGSVIWWKSLHQAPSFSLLFGSLVLVRMRTELAKTKAEARLARMAEA